MRERRSSTAIADQSTGIVFVSERRGSVGTWGEGVFENDDAADWVEELLDSTREEQLESIESAFAEVLNSTDYVEAPDASIAIAANAAGCLAESDLVGGQR